MFSLNGVALSDYGIIIDNFVGEYDMPKRLGTTEQSWANEDGVESFVDADDIKFAGRDLVLMGHVEAANHSQLISIIQNFYNDIDEFTGLVPLVTDNGTYQIYLPNGVQSEYVGQNYANLTIKFREPVSSFTGAIGTGTGVVINGIDDFDFYNDYLIKITTVEGRFTLPKMKKFNPVQYEAESFNIDKFETKDLIVNGYCEDLTKIPNLYSLLSSSGERVLNLDFDKLRNCYVRAGCYVTDIKDNTGLIEMKFRLVDPFVFANYLLTNGSDFLNTNDSFRILIK